MKQLLSQPRQTNRSLAVFKLPDSANYFLSHWHRILDKDFLPLGEDIVRSISLSLSTIFSCFKKLYFLPLGEDIVRCLQHVAPVLVLRSPSSVFFAIISTLYGKYECAQYEEA